MQFDWDNPPFEMDEELSAQEIEESFEDPFAAKLLPDSPRFEASNRFFNLGRSAGGKGVFSVYRTNGKQFRIISARLFEPEEMFFYKHRMKKLLN
ncbi:MAG: hypothetical protein CMO80_19320 [Verrucomicrobiales bacterium]|nr:hypothetical protein [Verrucomicrobiales bacterium]|tara:strand:+ start:776 stop:1060 length:285 start_codon:yes stop_codon:yes gene_type:complete